MAKNIFHDQYNAVKTACYSDAKGDETQKAIYLFSQLSLEFLLSECKKIELISRVPGKRYYSFTKNKIVARPVNDDLFIADKKLYRVIWEKWTREEVTKEEFARLSYTTALAPCLAMEIFDRQNKKGPATFFECYIGHVFSKAVDHNPTRKVHLPIADRSVSMTMDFLFDIAGKKRKVHVPVKMSTRERVVQAWAHQRLLDAAYGENKYLGVMVLFSETKLDSRTLEVVEICVPDQWLAYQTLLAKMDRIYYFDPPERYLALTTKYPDVIQIKQFGEFFTEKTVVLQ